MKKILTLLVLLCVWIIPGIGQVDVKTPARELNTSPSSPTVDKENSLLWEISGKDLKTPSYLYGTIHIIGKEDFFLTGNTKSAFAESERVVFEINMEEMNDFSVIFTLMGKVMMEGGTSLADLLSEEDYQLVEKKFAELGLPMMILNRLKPMFLSVFASGDIEPGSMSNGDMLSYEMEFMKMAQKGKKEMGGLETVEFQMSMFDSIPYQAQADMLIEAIKSESEGNDEFQKMVELYKNQDIKGMITMFDEGEGGVGGFEELLLVNRNKSWIPIMATMMADKPTFFAVGAGHLGGKSGVIELLRAEGYTVKSMRE